MYIYKMLKNYAFYVYFGLLLLLGSNLVSQTIQRQTISSSGNSTVSGPNLIRQTIGQPYQTTTNYETKVKYRPGFQQPIFNVKEISSNFSLTIFPNPASYFVNISVDKPLQNIVIKVIDGLGKEIYNTSLSEFQKFQIDCNTWANGNYLVTIYNNKENYSAKLILYR